MKGIRVLNAGPGDVPRIVISGLIGFSENDSSSAVCTFSDFRQAFVAVEAGNKRCELLINSQGGLMHEAFAMFDLIKNSPMVVDVIIYGMAASSAAWLSFAGDTVSIAENAMMMLHKPQAGNYGESDTLRSTAELMDKMEARVVSMLCERTGKTEKMVRDTYMKPGVETWLTAEEALQAGLVDTVVKAVHQSDAVSNHFQNATEAWKVYSVFNIAEQKPKTDNTMDKKAIINVLNAHKVQHELTDNSTDADVQSVLNAVLASNAALTQENENLKAAALAEVKKRATTLVENAVKAGKISETEKADWLKNAESNFDFVSNALAKLEGRKDINTTLVPVNGGEGVSGQANNAGDRSKWTLREWEQKDPTNLRKMMNSEPDRYKALFEAEYGGAG